MMLVPVFFYGGLIHPAVQERTGLEPRGTRHAVLGDYRITFEPWVNIRRASAAEVHGLIMEVSHAQLDKVYASLAADYFPIAVLCHRDDGQVEPALCYVAPEMVPGPIDRPHVQALIEGAELAQFPSDYIERVRAFLP